MSVNNFAPKQHIPGYAGHVPQNNQTYGITYGKATASVLSPIRSPSPFTYEYQNGDSQREVTQSPGTIPGPGFTAFIGKEKVCQGSEVDLSLYYKSLAVAEAEMKARAAELGIPVQQKKKTRNVSSIEMGDNYFWAGKHMFQTSNQETYPDVEKARRQALPIVRVNYGSVERDAAVEAAKMIQFKSHGQFSDMQKAFLEYDKDRSGTLDRDEMGKILQRFHIGDGHEGVVQALIDMCDKDGDGIINYDEFAKVLGSHMRSDVPDASPNKQTPSPSRVQ